MIAIISYVDQIKCKVIHLYIYCILLIHLTYVVFIIMSILSATVKRTDAWICTQMCMNMICSWLNMIYRWLIVQDDNEVLNDCCLPHIIDVNLRVICKPPLKKWCKWCSFLTSWCCVRIYYYTIYCLSIFPHL